MAFEDGACYCSVYVFAFAEEGATLVEAAFDFGNSVFANIELREARCEAELREELLGATDSFGNTDAVGAFGNTPNAFAILEDFVVFLFAKDSHSARENDGERFAVSDTVKGSELVADVVSSPVLRYAHSDETVKAHGGREHILRHEVVVLWIFLDLWSNFDEVEEDTFSPAVHERVDVWSSEVLFHDVHESVGDTAGNLIRRDRVGYLWVEDRPLRVERVETIFLFSCEIGDNGAVVHFGASGRHSHNRSKRDCASDFFRVEYEIPSVAIVADSAGDEFGAIESRATTYGDDEFYFFSLAEFDGTAKSFYFRVRFDAPEFDDFVAFEGSDNLVVDAIAFDTATAESEHYFGRARELFFDFGN